MIIDHSVGAAARDRPPVRAVSHRSLLLCHPFLKSRFSLLVCVSVSVGGALFVGLIKYCSVSVFFRRRRTLLDSIGEAAGSSFKKTRGETSPLSCLLSSSSLPTRAAPPPFPPLPHDIHSAIPPAPPRLRSPSLWRACFEITPQSGVGVISRRRLSIFLYTSKAPSAE